MPIYEFQCQACGHRFDELMRMSDPDPTECPSCHAQKVQRCVTAPSFRLAGSGWYETDFKGDKDTKRNLAGADKPADKPAEKPADAKPAAESKPVAAPAPAAKPASD